MTAATTAQDSPLAQHPLLAGYQPPAGVFDELAQGGAGHAQYLDLLSVLNSLSGDELPRRVDTARRLVEEQGITYNVYGDARGMERPWEIDPVPLVIAPDDCHGPQELIRSKWLPPALVFGQPGFLRPCRGIPAPHGVHLHFYAVDLARSPDGRWWVLSDRTQNPTGAGYALANRLVVSRSLPEALRAGHVAMANALGSGLLQSPAFMPFLPGLCRHLLDEEPDVSPLAGILTGGGEHDVNVAVDVEVM